jgi:hypothetical protein
VTVKVFRVEILTIDEFFKGNTNVHFVLQCHNSQQSPIVFEPDNTFSGAVLPVEYNEKFNIFTLFASKLC